VRYVDHINTQLRAEIADQDQIVCFGQNITAGSCLSGLTRSLPNSSRQRAINMPNCENALVAFGFGLMMQGVNSIYFVKQLDFLLLTCDQFVNTFNMVRLRPPRASFTIVATIVDSGYEGPQSRFNKLTELCSLADVPGYSIANGPDANFVIQRHLVAPGFRIICASQRLFGSEIAVNQASEDVSGNAEITCHGQGKDATIVSFNLSYPQANSLRKELAVNQIRTSLYSVPAVQVSDWSPIVNDVRKTGRLILIDDSRSQIRTTDRLRITALEAGIPCDILPVYRRLSESHISPNDDRFTVDAEQVRAFLLSAKIDTARPCNG